MPEYVIDLEDISLADAKNVGHDNAATGELIRQLNNKGIHFPSGFVTTRDAYKDFLQRNNLEKQIEDILAKLNQKNLKSFDLASNKIKKLILAQSFSAEFKKAVTAAYKNLDSDYVAVRGPKLAVNVDAVDKQDSYLHLKGINPIFDAIKKLFASAFSSHEIMHRFQHGILHMEMGISACVQSMVGSDKAVSGVIYTIDPKSGFDQVALLTAAYGLHQADTQNNHDHFYLHKLGIEEGRLAVLQSVLGKKKTQAIYAKATNSKKLTKTIAVAEKMQQRFCLTQNEAQEIARKAIQIEKYFQKPMKIEWVKEHSKIYIVQAHPVSADHQLMETKKLPRMPLKMCMNMSNPANVFEVQNIPNDGVGLSCLEDIISKTIGIHPSAVLNLEDLPLAMKKKILNCAVGYSSPKEFYIEKLREGIAKIAAAFFPKQVIFRFSDFRSDEHAKLLGGDLFEVEEKNPLIGFRGASRYRNSSFIKCFELECMALARVRDEMGLHNVQLMVPFVRTVEELKQVIQLTKNFGLQRGLNDLKIYMMCEIPSNVILAEEFLKFVDGFSIGSNDLTQLVLGVDRESAMVAHLFDEKNEAVKVLLRHVIKKCKRLNKYIGICSQAPSVYPDLAKWLLREGIQSISLNPESLMETWLELAEIVN